MGPLKSAGVTCKSWEPDSANPDYQTRCDDPMVWVFIDPLAFGEEESLMDSTAALYKQVFEVRGGGAARGDNWIIGAADPVIFGKVLQLGGTTVS